MVLMGRTTKYEVTLNFQFIQDPQQKERALKIFYETSVTLV